MKKVISFIVAGVMALGLVAVTPAAFAQSLSQIEGDVKQGVKDGDVVVTTVGAHSDLIDKDTGKIKRHIQHVQRTIRVVRGVDDDVRKIK